jgi:hypothetical protein
MKRARLDRTDKVRGEQNRQTQCAWLFLTRGGKERLVAKNRRVSPAKSLMPGGLVGASIFEITTSLEFWQVQTVPVSGERGMSQ